MASAGTGNLPVPWIRSPLIESQTLSKIAGCRIFLKLENLQPSGSFKSRGVGNYLREHLAQAGPSDARPHFYCSSGGNAGLACVTAASTLGCASTIIVPHSTKAHMIAKIRAAGATEVIQYGATWRDADTHLRKDILPRDAGGVYVPPFDDPGVWRGNATIMHEILADLGDATRTRPEVANGVTSPSHAMLNGEEGGQGVGAVICSVGGGGLFTGLILGSEGTDTRLVAVETQGADSLNQAIEAGELITLPGITSIATSLGAVRVAERAFKYAMDEKERVKSVVLSDEQALRACVRFAEEERMVVEPACGVSIALIYEGLLGQVVQDLQPETKVVIVVCGGRAVGLDMLQEWKGMYP